MSLAVGIVGGGLVGLTAALVFRHQGQAVKLIEANANNPGQFQQVDPATLDSRSIALSYSTITLFQSIGLWPTIEPFCAPIGNIHISTAGHFGVTRLKATDLGLGYVGQVIEYHHLMSVLWQSVSEQSDIEVLAPARVAGIEQTNDTVTLQINSSNSQTRAQVDLLVVADGAQSMVDMLGLELKVVDYHQSAIVANVKTQSQDSSWAFERFTANGPLAMLPLPNQRYALVWTNSPERSQQLLSLDNDAFLDRLYQAFGLRLGYFDSIGERSGFELRMKRTQPLVSGRCVLIGNAANTLHPVAGQGFNLGVRDIGALHDLIESPSQGNLTELLQQYPSLRLADHEMTVGLGNGLVNLFSNDLPLLNHLRAAALFKLDNCTWLKKEVGWIGMGYGGGSSSLMRSSSALQAGGALR